MALALFKHITVVVRGGGDLASGVIYRLVKAGFPVIVTELARPLAIRRTVAFASAIYEGQITVDGLTACRAQHIQDIPDLLAANQIPVLVDEHNSAVTALAPAVVVDARMMKHNPGTTCADARLVIALGPGYTAGADCHAVIETNRGHNLGRVIWQGSAEPDTGQPGEMKGVAADRVLRAPADGYVVPYAAIGDMLRQDEPVASVGGRPVYAPFDGVLRGLIHPSVSVTTGLKIGDLDPRARPEYCFTISEKALAVGGGVLEAVLSAPAITDLLPG